LQGHWALDEASGGRLDSSGRGNHLADNNTVGSVAGQVGPAAADFERDNQEYLSIDDAAQSGLDISGSLTLVGWMNPESLDAIQVLAAKYQDHANKRAYRLDVRSSSLLGFVVSRDGKFSSDYLLEANLLEADPPFSALSPGTWYHVAGVFDAEQRSLAVYLNGDLVAWRSVTYDTIHNSSAPFMLGANLDKGGVAQYFDGQLDDWRVYSRALTEGEIESLMAPPP
jgi:hypothetical protein